MKFFVDILSFNKNNFPDSFLIESKNTRVNKRVCIETDLFEISGKYHILLDCREINLEEEILNIKYLKTTFKK